MLLLLLLDTQRLEELGLLSAHNPFLSLDWLLGENNGEIHTSAWPKQGGPTATAAALTRNKYLPNINPFNAIRYVP